MWPFAIAYFENWVFLPLEELLRAPVGYSLNIAMTLIARVAQHFVERIALRQLQRIKPPENRRLPSYFAIESPGMITYGACLTVDAFLVDDGNPGTIA